MAFLGELGQKYPVAQKGVDVPLDDQTAEMFPGDILEAQYTSDRDLNADAVQDIIHETLKMKEQYPGFVLHYLKFETRRITAQFSVAPMGGTISSLGDGHGITLGLGLTIVLVVAALAGIIVGAYAALISIDRQIILRPPPPLGNALIATKDHETGRAIPNVAVSVDGEQVGATSPDGAPVLVEDLLAGPHIFTGEPVAGYWDPKAIHYDVKEGEQIVVTIVYHPDDEPPPTHGYLIVDTTPVKGEVWIEGESYGIAPIEPILLLEGEYEIWFGEVEGYIAPPPQTATVIAGETEPRIGTYKLPGINWWEKYIKYALIGGGAIIAAAVLVPRLIQALTRRKEPK